MQSASKRNENDGDIKAHSPISLDIETLHVHDIIGEKGAGGSMLFNIVTGVIAFETGRVAVCGGNMPNGKCYLLVPFGFARTFKNVRLCKNLSVLENVLLGMSVYTETATLSVLFKRKTVREGELKAKALAMSALEFVGLVDQADELAKNLSYGQQRLIECARAIAAKPKVLLLDETPSGTGANKKMSLANLIKKLREEKYTVVLLEHDMSLAMNLYSKTSPPDMGIKLSAGDQQFISNHQTLAFTYPWKNDRMLKVEALVAGYGATDVLHKLSFCAPKGEITTLIGTSGAGKSTALNAIMGVVRTRSGSISWCDRLISGKKTFEIVRQGIALVPEDRHIFPEMTVRENLFLGAYARSDKKEIVKDFHWVMELFPRLKDRLKQEAGALCEGEQQMLALGRAIMAHPELILLDEPSMGIAPFLVEEIFAVIREICRQGKTILLVEQNAFLALNIAKQAYVIELGQVSLAGSGEQLRANPEVERAYLGL